MAKAKKKSSGKAQTRTCNACGATVSSGWEICSVCGNDVCDQCAVECDGCKGIYCVGKCGTDYIDEESHAHCYNCK
ncbi:MAG: hypothetical protein ACTSUE_00480 [Promethearchaeota archaeon]